MGNDIAYFYGTAPKRSIGMHVVPGQCRYNTKTGKETAHPCPRKLIHAEWLVKWWSAPTDTVIDPFAGSGTTLLAAVNLGRPAIGIEIEERYCEMAARRFDQQILPVMVPQSFEQMEIANADSKRLVRPVVRHLYIQASRLPQIHRAKAFIFDTFEKAKEQIGVLRICRHLTPLQLRVPLLQSI